MSNVIEDTSFVHQDMTFHLIPTKKFKTVNIVVKLKAPLDRKTITKRALLTFILEQGTKNYPSEQQLMKQLDELYGADLSVHGQKKGNEHIFTVRLEVANEKYLKNESTIMKRSLELLHEVVFAPNREAGLFPEKIVNREKNSLQNAIESVQDDKMAYANMRMLDHMCPHEKYGIHVQGYVEDLHHLHSEHLSTYYDAMIKEDDVDIYIVGDIDEVEIKTLLKQQFTLKRNERHQFTPVKDDVKVKNINEVIEKQSVNQAKLHIGYRTNITYSDDAYFALHIFNGLFGGFPNSKLFMNVREKHSLAYYAASRIESHKGLLIVYSGIEGKNYEKAKEIIELQLQAMKDGNFSDDDVENAKELIISDIKETLDHSTGIVEILYQQIVGNKRMLPHEFINGIKQVTKMDVIKVANMLQTDTVYLLKSGKEENHDA